MVKFAFSSIRWLLIVLTLLAPSHAWARNTAPQPLPLGAAIFERDGKELATIRVEIADETDEQRYGLMFRESLPADAGMLFIYEPPYPATMWMKNTLIPLDMVFIDHLKQIVHIHANAEPHSLTPIGARQDVWAVLELNGGTAEKLGLRKGDRLRYITDEQEKEAVQ